MDRELKSSHTHGCAHCGLRAPAGLEYCCYGCELAAQIQREARDDDGHLLGTLSFTLVLTMVVMMLSLFLYAEDVFSVTDDAEMGWLRSIYRWASLVLATPVMIFAGTPLVKGAWVRLSKRQLSMEALIVLASFAAYSLSVVSLVSGGTEIYFDSATAAVVLATFGRYLEATARQRASGALGPLLEISKGQARQLLQDGTLAPISVEEIQPGMRVVVDHEHIVPVDLELSTPWHDVDMAVLSGESRPVRLVRGAKVPQGSVPVEKPLEGVALSVASESTVERLSQLAKSLADRPTSLQRWADRFASVLTPVVAVVAICVFAYWSSTASLDAGIIAALSVVLAACPCTYAIASPLAHWMAMKSALAHGVLIRGADALEGLTNARTVVFDKTGTLTESELRVVRETFHGIERDEALALVCALEQNSKHPVGRALFNHAGSARPAFISNERALVGKGVEAVDEQGRRLFIGRTGDAVALVRDGETIARFEIDETLRPDAHTLVTSLADRGLRPVIASGDTPARVREVADALGIEGFGGLDPAGKARLLSDFGPHTAMVGDGFNDAPALAETLLSFSFGGASHLAKSLAKVTLLEPKLSLIDWTFDMAGKTLGRVRFLLAASTTYNLLFVGLAAAGALRPVWAGLSMLLSSLLTLAFASSAHVAEPEATPRELVAEAAL